MKAMLLAACVFSAAATANATIWGFAAPIINQAQEVPPTNSTAYGSASFTIDDATYAMSGSVTITGLGINEVTGMHVHLGPVGVNGPVIFDILANTVSTFETFTVSNWFFSGELTGGGGFTREQKLAAMVAGNSYINAHTAAFPNGEIRGQVECIVPEPTTFVMLGIGFASALFLKRRR